MWATEILVHNLRLLPQGQKDHNQRPQAPDPEGPPPGYRVEDNSAWGGTDYNSLPGEPPQGFVSDEIPF
jgi:hypothetical protein